MKFLKVSHSTLELGKVMLSEPMLVLGRAPSCDLVLRAPSVQPVHFVVEWLGTGAFDANVNRWSITDVALC